MRILGNTELKHVSGGNTEMPTMPATPTTPAAGDRTTRLPAQAMTNGLATASTAPHSGGSQG